ncbi:hypothetical protein Bca52824_038735 [Brassica carinata]|uniref:RecA-like N-terminal domain-containing protein n=1 Tax=Brassica carinata TaxID=52824 RepID=A0A8X7UW88_BRACI|nr:hypothetical protein Bca52824_038735 [Brassica carinata]
MKDVLWRYRALGPLDTSVCSCSVGVIGADSVGELEDEMGDAHMAIQAKLMSQAFHKLSHSLSLWQNLIIIINQVKKGEELKK